MCDTNHIPRATAYWGSTIAIITAHVPGPHIWPSQGPWLDFTCSTTDVHVILEMRLGNHSQIASIQATSVDLRRIQTPHSLFRDFGADKTFTFRWSGCKVQVSVQVQAPARHLAIRLFKTTANGFVCKVNGQALGTVLLHSLGPSAGLMAKHKNRVFPDKWQ